VEGDLRMRVDERLPLKGPVFEHDCDKCVFLGHYEKHDLYYCGENIGTVIARWSSNGPDYASGVPLGIIPLRDEGMYSSELAAKILRVAYLIAADLGYLPFAWKGIQIWPYNCEREE